MVSRSTGQRPSPARIYSISTAEGGLTGGNAASDNASIDLLGGVIVFDSLATNLSAFGGSGRQVFFAVTGTIAHISSRAGVGGNAASQKPDVSDDGTTAVFESLATNLGAVADTNGFSDVFRVASLGAPVRVSVTNAGAQANGASTNATVNGDGTLVVFQSTATNLLGGVDANGAISDIFLRDTAAGTTERISLGYAGAEPNGASVQPHISNNGRWVTFASDATNLIEPGINLNGARQCYVYDRERKSMELVSANLAGDGGNGTCSWPNIELSGRYITYAANSTNVDPLQTAAVQQIYFFDRLTGQVLVASGDVTTKLPSAGPVGPRSSIGSVNLGLIVFASAAGDFSGISDVNGLSDVYGDIISFGTTLNPSGFYADFDQADTILHVYDNLTLNSINTQIPMQSVDGLGQVAVAAGRAAIATSDGTGIPTAGAIWDQEAGGVLRLMGGGTVFPIRVAISESIYCAIDAASGLLVMGDPATGAATYTSVPVSLTAESRVQATGQYCATIGSDDQLYTSFMLGPFFNGWGPVGPASDFQMSDEGIAYRTCEAAIATDLNGDTDLSDCVMRFFDLATSTITETGHVAIPCTFPGCDPFFEPYRSGPGFVSFVTSEPQEMDSGSSGAVGIRCLPTSPAGVCDKTGDEDGDDIAVEIYNLASGKAQVFPVDMKNPPSVDPFPKVMPGSKDNVMVVQLPASLLGADFASLPAAQLVTVIVGDPEGDGVFEADGNTDPETTVVDKCQEVADPAQIDADGDGMAEDCDFVVDTTVPNDDPVNAPAPAQLPGSNLCDLNKSGTIIRPEVDQIWFDRGTRITRPVDVVAPFGVFEPTDDRDRDVDGEISAVDFRLCLADCAAQVGGCPNVEGGGGGFGFGTGGYGCGLLGIEVFLVLVPLRLMRRRMRKGRR